MGGRIVAGDRDANKLIVGTEVAALRGRAAWVSGTGGRVETDLKSGIEFEREGMGLKGEAEGLEVAIPVLKDGGAGVVLGGDSDDVLHEAGAGGCVGTAQGDLAEGLCLRWPGPPAR